MSLQLLAPEIGRDLGRITADLNGSLAALEKHGTLQSAGEQFERCLAAAELSSGSLAAIARHSALRGLSQSVESMCDQLSTLTESLAAQLRHVSDSMRLSAQMEPLAKQVRRLSESFTLPLRSRSFEAALYDELESMRCMERFVAESLHRRLQAIADAYDLNCMMVVADPLEELVAPPQWLRHLKDLQRDPLERVQSAIDDIVTTLSLHDRAPTVFDQSWQDEPVDADASTEDVGDAAPSIEMFVDVDAVADCVEAEFAFDRAQIEQCTVEIWEAVYRIRQDVLALARRLGIDVADGSTALVALTRWLTARSPELALQLQLAADGLCAAMTVVLAPPGPTRSGTEVLSRDVVLRVLDPAYQVRRILDDL